MRARYTLEYDPNDVEDTKKVHRALTADNAYSVLFEIRELCFRTLNDGEVHKVTHVAKEVVERINASIDLETLWS